MDLGRRHIQSRAVHGRKHDCNNGTAALGRPTCNNERALAVLSRSSPSAVLTPLPLTPALTPLIFP